jgi:superfamily II DNA or RNA helicase/HKD family nuclease/diadenosine tetraphosphate (Ap4A) HIT family hydrolase
MPHTDCPFCYPDPRIVVAELGPTRILSDQYPLHPGHCLITHRRHFARWDEASAREQRALLDAITPAYEWIHKHHKADSFNVGWNDGTAAGQTVAHFHIHVIPRLRGDVPDPRGGVRWVLPDRAPYWRSSALPEDLDLLAAPHTESLISGDDDPLLPHLASAFAQAKTVDIAVAFVMRRGVELLRPHLEDLLARTGDGPRLRLLTGDYLDATDPDGLDALLDLPGRHQLRVFESKGQSFHPKSYVFHFRDGRGIAFVGSSNLSKAALENGIEWNYRVVRSHDQHGFAAVVEGFDRLFAHSGTRALTRDWVRDYRSRRPNQTLAAAPIDLEAPITDFVPHEIQKEALEALSDSRARGDTAGLVVLATGLGKTWLAAFDSAQFERVLFVAHREEILDQALRTFRRMRPDAALGKYTGTEKVPEADVLFASVQTLSRAAHLERFEPKHFDYLIVDEFHHASARTYRALIDYFEPQFFLGLTATPERSDGADLLQLCGHNLVYSCGLGDGIRRGLLSPFHYLGVPDDVDYEQIKWRSGRFDEAELTSALASQKRADNAFENYERHAGTRGLSFCCSQRHADFMAQWFNDRGKRAAAVHAGETSAPRTLTLQALERGELDIVFSVDMFNEGVDVPTIDTVLMLRPTESRIIWLQQLGRGLRRTEGKERLHVIDYIGNHRVFLNKPQALLGALIGLGEGQEALRHALDQVKRGVLELPEGCEISYELVETLLSDLLKPTNATERLRASYLDFRERHGRRPTPAELHDSGSLPKATLRSAFDSWFGMVEALHDLTEKEREVRDQSNPFLAHLETTRMVSSFEMLVLQAVLAAEALQGELRISELTNRFHRIAQRTPLLRSEVATSVARFLSLEAMLRENVVAAWANGDYFELDGDTLRSKLTLRPELHETLHEMVTELVDWRLAEYLGSRSSKSFECTVFSNQRHPILKLPQRAQFPDLPEGRVELWADGQRFEAQFAKIAINAIYEPGDEDNQLPELLRRWFGEEAGQPGRSESVVCEREGEGWRMRPLRRQLTETLKVHGEDGQDVDASFRIERSGDEVSALFFSRGGKASTKSARNTEYAKGLKILLDRMAQLGVLLSRVELDSKGVGDKLPAEERELQLEGFAYPIPLGEIEAPAQLLSALKRAQARAGRKPGAKGSGNSTKQIRLSLTLPESVSPNELGQQLQTGSDKLPGS